MRDRPTVILTALLLASGVRAQSLAITHVTVIDTTGGPVRPDTTVVIGDGRITSIGGSSPSGAQIVDGRAKFLIPGLWDMRVHLSWRKESALRLLVASGLVGQGRDIAQQGRRPRLTRQREDRRSLLDANPLDDIHDTQRIAAVVVNGKLLRRTDLDAMLREAEEMAKRE